MRDLHLMTHHGDTFSAMDEEERLRAVHDYGLLDSPPDPVFDDLTALAAKICGTPISLVSLIDRNRQWFKSHHGLPVSETPRSVSFCDHTIRMPGDVVVVADASRDPRFAHNPLVTGEPKIRFYAAAPLRTPEGYALGTLCVIDSQPRELSPEQLEALRILARQAMSQLELRHALNALRMSEQRFESVARAVSDVIWDWDLDTGEVWWSEGFHAVFGHQPGTHTAGALSWSEHIHPDERRRVLGGLQRAIETGEASWQDEYRFARADGSYANVQDRAQILRNRNAIAHRVVGGKTDVTERRRLESQYLRSQRMESIGALAGGIAHDLNNVLTPILMSISMLQDRMKGDPTAANMLTILESSAVRGAALVRQVLSFARGVEGAHCATSVSHVLNEVWRLAQETFPRSIDFRTYLPGDVWHVHGDSTQLHQVFMNLLVNARDAMPTGGTLTVRVANEQLSEAECAPFQKRGGAYVVASIEDTGVGIPREILDRIFEPFFTTKPHGTGTGLGLSTVHGIVANHGGFIRVKSTLGSGSTFEVCLPAIINSGRAQAELAHASPTRGHGELLLLIDDESSIRSIAAQTLQSNGYRVLTAENGVDALNVFSAHVDDIALVITDLMMPVMDGTTCAREMRKLRPDLPVIATSGVQRGAATVPTETEHVLAKPYTAEAILALVRRILDDPAHRVDR